MSTLFFHETPTILDVINVAKVTSGMTILFAAGRYGWTPRSTIYASLHMSYLVWWMMEQYFFPPFWNRFSVEVPNPIDWIPTILVIGILYTLPAYNVFCRKDRVTEISAPMTMVCVMMFTLGSLINTTSDVNMHATKAAMAPQKVLVTTGMHRLCQNPNWFGDYLRYASFCLTSGKPSSFVVLAMVMLVNYGTTTDPSLKGGMLSKYGATYEEWVRNVPNVVIPSFANNNVLGLICSVSAIWFLCYGLGALTRRKAAKTKSL